MPIQISYLGHLFSQILFNSDLYLAAAEHFPAFTNESDHGSAWEMGDCF